MSERWLKLTIAAVAMTFATVGSAAIASTGPARYQPRNGARCRPGYTRQIKRVIEHQHGKRIVVKQVWCVRKPAPVPPPVPTPTAPAPTPPSPMPTSTFANANFESTFAAPPYQSWFDVSGSIFYGSGTELKGQPITFTITDATTGQTVATFPGTSNGYATCTIAYTANNQTQTFSGQAVAPYQACALPGTVAVPASDVAVLSASFAGNSTFAPSSSTQTAL